MILKHCKMLSFIQLEKCYAWEVVLSIEHWNYQSYCEGHSQITTFTLRTFRRTETDHKQLHVHSKTVPVYACPEAGVKRSNLLQHQAVSTILSAPQTQMYMRAQHIAYHKQSVEHTANASAQPAMLTLPGVSLQHLHGCTININQAPASAPVPSSNSTQILDFCDVEIDKLLAEITDFQLTCMLILQAVYLIIYMLPWWLSYYYAVQLCILLSSVWSQQAI